MHYLALVRLAAMLVGDTPTAEEVVQDAFVAVHDKQEQTMSFDYRQQHQLRRIEAGLRRTDPHLGAMLGIFGQLYPDEDRPEWERVLRVPASLGRLRRAAAWIRAALTLAVVIGVLLGQAAIEATAPRRGCRTLAPSAGEADTGQSDDRDQKPPRNGRADGGLRQPDGPA